MHFRGRILGLILLKAEFRICRKLNIPAGSQFSLISLESDHVLKCFPDLVYLI